MRIIQFKENQKEIWNKFIAENCSESFLQSWEWGEFQKNIDRKIFRIGVIEDFRDFKHTPSASQPTPLKRGMNNIASQSTLSQFNLLAVALIIKHDLPFGRSYFYCPRGPVVGKSKAKSQKSKILDLLFDEIKKIAKKEKSLFLKIDPAIKMNHKSQIINHKYSNNLKKCSKEIQPRNTLILDITKSEEELLKEMKQKTRYNIRLAGKKKLRITNLAYRQAGYELRMDNKKDFKEKFEEFWELVEETSKRDKFASHNKNYYWKMLENLAGAGLQSILDVLQEGKIQDTRSNNQKNINNQISRNKQNLQAKLYLAEYENKIITANIVLSFGDMAVYLHGASSNENRNLMAPYLLQWRQIMDAKKAGCKKYDFWGIAPESKVKSQKLKVNSKFQNSWSGITRFKKGFGGHEKNYIGAYDLIFSDIGYPIYKLIKSIKLKVCKFKSLFCKN